MAEVTPETASIRELIQIIVCASEKGGTIARMCRAETELFSLLIEEKKPEEKNKRFIQDFKTLADVLVQETIKVDLSKKYPAIGNNIFGEESNEFKNALGETIQVQITSDREETFAMLSTVLNENEKAAELLAFAVHSKVETEVDTTLLPSSAEIPVNQLGIWIDPIDSTSEYIHGKWEEPEQCGLVLSGLQCACILIGVYSLQTGKPILGIVNQPFHFCDRITDRWMGRWFWGLSWNGINASSEVSAAPKENGIILMSTSEDEKLVAVLKKKYKVIFVAGAGYKILSVYLGLADFYILSKETTYKWDVCGPHALLLSIGGGIISYSNAIKCPINDLAERISDFQLLYNDNNRDDSRGIDRWCNKDGVVAYRSLEALKALLLHLGR